jgi:hypothetical protein
VRRGFYVSGHEPEQTAVLDQLRKQLLHAREHPVAVGLLDRLVQVAQPALEQAGELLALGLAVQHRLEGLAAHLGIGHPRVGVLADVGWDAVELVERELPRGGPGPARSDQRAVDVEQDGHALVGHPGSVVRPTRPAPRAADRA